MGAAARAGEGEGGDFCVTVTEREVVAAALPVQDHWLPLSNLDLLLPPLDFCVFFCYKNTGGATFRTAVGGLKEALAEALVSYYAFAGEVVANSVGEPELICNNRGVDFAVAAADVQLCCLNLYNPDDSVEGKLVPKKKHGVLSVQVTELKCEGLVVSCTFDHRIADAYSANMFLVAWAHLSLSKSISKPSFPQPLTLPSFRRSLLNPRRPGRFPPSLDNLYMPVSAIPTAPNAPLSTEADNDCLASRIYYVPAEQLSRLQSLAGASKLVSFSSFLWKVVATGCPLASDKCKMGLVVNGRGRLADGDKAKSVEMAAYFGNVLSIPFGVETAAQLKEMRLCEVAAAVERFLEPAINKEHFLGLIDWVEAHRPEPALTKIYGVGSKDGPAFVVSSGQRFPAEEIDFGWGRSAFRSYHFPWGGDAGYVMPMPSPAREGDWVVYAHLFKRQLEFMESRATDVFRPLNAEYLKIDSFIS